MALTKYFVILFLAYLNFGISPLNSAVIPERSDPSESLSVNDYTTVDFESYSTTTVPTEDDIGKIFESYENAYIKNHEDTETNEKKLDGYYDDESTQHDLETTESTADDVAESDNIVGENADAKKNRTDRTIVVVVTTNVFNINGSDESNRRQHTLVSFGTPAMFTTESSTDATLATHNKSSINAQANGNNKSTAEDSEAVDMDDTFNDLDAFKPEDEKLLDVSTTEKSSQENENDNSDEIFDKMDIRQLPESADKPTAIESNLVDKSTNDNSDDVMRVIKILPGRNDDDNNLGSLAKPFDVRVEESPDSSLMEAIENILDTDVRKAFERDIPQTRHVPLDINIEPLKDLSEYVVEENPVKENYPQDVGNNTEPVGSMEKVKDIPNDNNSKLEPEATPVTENGVTVGHSTEVPAMTSTTMKEAVTTTIPEVTTLKSNAIDIEREVSATTITSNSVLDVENMKLLPIDLDDMHNIPITENTKEIREKDDATKENSEIFEDIESSEKFKSSVAPEQDEKPKIELVSNTEGPDDIPAKVEIEVEIKAEATSQPSSKKLVELSNLDPVIDDNILFPTPANQQKEFDPELSREPDSRLKKPVGHTNNDYPNFENPYTTTDSSITAITAPLGVDDFINYFNEKINKGNSKQRNENINPILKSRIEAFMKKMVTEWKKKISEPNALQHINQALNFVEGMYSTTAKPDEEDVVSEVAKIDEETTEQHQIIKKPGVLTNVDTNDLLTSSTLTVEGRSIGNNAKPVYPLRTLFEGDKLTAEIPKAFDYFQSINSAIDPSLHVANQVIENIHGTASVWEIDPVEQSSTTTTRALYISGGIFSIGLFILLVLVSVIKYRQFKRNILFIC